MTLQITGWPKKLAHFCTPCNFIKYWPIFNFFTFRIRRKFCNNSITRDPTTPQMCAVSTLSCEMSMS